MDLYYYLNGQNEQEGPVQENELLKHGVTKDTLVWKEGMNDWIAAGTTPELSGLFASRLATVAQTASKKNTPPIPKPAPKIQPHVERTEEPKKQKTKASFWEWFLFIMGWCIIIFSGLMICAGIALSIDDDTDWGVGDTIGFMLFSIFMFGIGYVLAFKIKKIKKSFDKSRGME
jgi:hypothetical protein